MFLLIKKRRIMTAKCLQVVLESGTLLGTRLSFE